MKNPAAVALAQLRRGIKERPSERKREAARRNAEKARAVRWLKLGQSKPVAPVAPQQIHLEEIE